ncbi:MAG: DNA-processing protein DprA [Crinalium sp.]
MILNHRLQPDTQVILLLCASFGQDRQTEPQPLTLKEYNALAGWLKENKLTPGDLLNPTYKNQLAQINIDKLNSDRLMALLERGVMLSLAVEKWTSQGLWVIGRSDAEYPQPLKQKLRFSAPPIIYGVGNIELLSQGGLAVVGSRDVDEEGLNYTQKVVKTCAEQGIQIISGGARGVDLASMLGVLKAGGTAVAVLAESLVKAAVAGKYRAAIKEGKLCLISVYDPNVSFHVGNAMGRNKYIYALSDYALVVNSTIDQGGTWAGATEALEKIKDVPIFVRIQGNVPKGNTELLNRGAKPFPEEFENDSLREILEVNQLDIEPIAEETLLNSMDAVTDAPLLNLVLEEESKGEEKAILLRSRYAIAPLTTDEENKTDLEAIAPSTINIITEASAQNSLVQVQNPPKDIYEAVLPFILNHLEQPKDAKSLAECLDVRSTQMQDWLNRAVLEGKVKKNRKPVTYEINPEKSLLSLLEPI